VVESVAEFMRRIDSIEYLQCPHCGEGKFLRTAPIAPERPIDLGTPQCHFSLAARFCHCGLGKHACHGYVRASPPIRVMSSFATAHLRLWLQFFCVMQDQSIALSATRIASSQADNPYNHRLLCGLVQQGLSAAFSVIVGLNVSTAANRRFSLALQHGHDNQHR
jgi:hypothetical protein